MNFYFTKTPWWITKLFRSQLWRFSTKKKVLYLTFDDGPTDEVTEWVLDELAKYQAKATFFCLGKNIAKNIKVFDRLTHEGHGLGNHTYEHLNGWKTSNKDYFNSVQQTEEIIKSTMAKTAKLFRPPYGKIKRSQTRELKEHGYEIIMWSVLSADFDHSIDNNKCLANVINNTSAGHIIVFHDSLKAFEKLHFVLPQVLKHFTELGYTFDKIRREIN